MSIAKTSKKSTPTPVQSKPDTDAERDVDLIEGAGDTDISTSPTSLTKAQRAFIQRTNRFLLNIQSPLYTDRAAKNGYSPAEHAEGGRLWAIAAGRDRPLDHFFTEQHLQADAGEITADRLRIFQELDTFENTWFPRVRAIIRRMVPRPSRDTFAAAFFANLEQQPLGPMVVDSVRTLLQRIKELEKSKEPGAKEVATTLVKRGLTPTKLATIESLLREAEQSSPNPRPKRQFSPADIAKAQAAQLDAFEDLRDWFNDVATQLRPIFTAREQLTLGLVTPRTRSRGAADDDSDLDEADDLDDEPEAAPAPTKATSKPKGG